MRTAGFSDLNAVRAFYSLLTYVFGSLLWELPRVDAWNRALDGLDPDAAPNLVARRDGLVTGASTDQFEYGLEHLVSSLRQHAKPGHRRTRRDMRL